MIKGVAMGKDWFVRLLQATAITVTLAAVCQELEKPKEERDWHGKVGFIPYDFRMPTLQRLKQGYWNPDSANIFSPEVCGIGWAINFYALLEKMRIISEAYYSEEEFLMPTQTMRKVLEKRPIME
jgi:hypothetical protein